MGRAGRHPVAGRERLGALCRGQVRRRAQGHERRRRRRGQDREASSDAGRADACARALRHDVAGARPDQRSAGRIRGDAEQGAAPSGRRTRRRRGRGEIGRRRQGARALRRRRRAHAERRSGAAADRAGPRLRARRRCALSWQAARGSPYAVRALIRSKPSVGRFQREAFLTSSAGGGSHSPISAWRTARSTSPGPGSACD